VGLVDVAEAEVADEPLGAYFEPLAQRLAPGRRAPADPQVHQVKAVDPERGQVGLHGGADVGGSALGGPAGAEDGTDLGRVTSPGGYGNRACRMRSLARTAPSGLR
jgi:hypothetical protein